MKHLLSRGGSKLIFSTRCFSARPAGVIMRHLAVFHRLDGDVIHSFFSRRAPGKYGLDGDSVLLLVALVHGGIAWLGAGRIHYHVRVLGVRRHLCSPGDCWYMDQMPTETQHIQH